EGRIVPHERHAIRGQRHLRCVELAVAQHPEKRLLDEKFVIDEIDALGMHAAVGERAGSVVVPAGEGELESRHGVSHRLLCKGGAARERRENFLLYTVTGSVSSAGKRPCLAPSL